jgi:transmembrane sensor
MRLFRNREQRVSDRAGAWLARMRGEPSERDRRRFLAWYNRDPSHAEAYDSQARYWDAAPEVGLTSPIAGPAARPARSSPAQQRYALAAVLLAAVGLAAIVLLAGTMRPPAAGAPQMFLLATAVGEVREVKLGEGARLILDTDSAVRLRAQGRSRRVELQRGRIRLETARGAAPLLVAAGAAEIETDGAGLFDVRVEAGSTTVTSLGQDVAVRSPTVPQGAATRLGSGRSLVLAGPGAVRLKQGGDWSTRWPDGMLEFDGAPLGAVVAEANRYSRRKLRLADPALARLRVTGAYRAGDLQGLSRSLAEAFRLELTDAPGKDLLLRARSA